MSDSPAEGILRYHEETKHHPDRYARSLGYMDYDNQPNPFRFYEGAPVIALPLLAKDPVAGHLGLYEPDRSPEPFTTATMAGFLELSMGLSAWKAVSGSRWALRMNPSSGNLHPTEAHLILPPTREFASGVFHYSPLRHALEQRAEIPAELWQSLRAQADSDGFWVGLSSIFWRESWKYGERAFRYCNHDVGHALAALRFSANLFGWGLTCLDGLPDAAIATVLGFSRTTFPAQEDEHPDLLGMVHPHGSTPSLPGLSDETVAAFAGLAFQGQPNRLSREHVDWEIIARAAAQSRKPTTAARWPRQGQRPRAATDAPALSAAEVIRRRRSATAFDRRKAIACRDFIAMLDNTLPRDGIAPFDVGLMPAALHLVIFVHAVDGLTPGLYLLCRNDDDLPDLRRLTRPDFAWRPVAPDFPLFLLTEGDFRQAATRLSCHQDIAGSGAFCLGMLARFGERVRREPFRYRHLFWESGMIGQTLYLEAEAHRVRGTGIGCFFDDEVHELLGLETDDFQSLYHFTVGTPVEDSRLTTLPPYFHLKDR